MSKSGAPPKTRRFVPPSRIYRIEIGDGLYEGVFLRVKSVPVGRFLELAALADGTDVETIKAGGLSTVEVSNTFSQMGKLFQAFADKLIEWNVEELDNPDDIESDDEDAPSHPVPTTLEGVMSLDFDFLLFLIGEWLGAMGGVSGPLETKPSESETSGDEVLLALESTSQPNSPVPS